MTIELQLKKKCRRCLEWKFKNDFSPAPKNKDGRFSYCKKCNAIKVKEHRRRNLSKLEISRISRQQAITQIKAEAHCVRCGAWFPNNPEVMDFDHTQDKKFNISQVDGRSVQEIIKEMEKCQLLCANCHRIITRQRRDGIDESLDTRIHKQNQRIIRNIWSIYDRRNSTKA